MAAVTCIAMRSCCAPRGRELRADHRRGRAVSLLRFRTGRRRNAQGLDGGAHRSYRGLVVAMAQFCPKRA